MPPEDWVTYEVPPGTTLFRIGLSVDATVAELQDANCFEDINRITSGDVIYVPRLPTEDTLQYVSQVEGCDSPAYQLTSPTPGQSLNMPFTVFGTASADDFWYYKLEIRPDDDPNYRFLLQSEARVFDGPLGQVTPSAFAPGVYWLRLVVVDQSGNVPQDATCAIPIIFE